MEQYFDLCNVFDDKTNRKFFISDKDSLEAMFIIENGTIQERVLDYLNSGISISYDCCIPSIMALVRVTESYIKDFTIGEDESAPSKSFLDFNKFKSLLVENNIPFEVKTNG